MSGVCLIACQEPLDKQLDDAIDFSDPALVQALLAKGGNPNLLDSDGDPKLISLARVHVDEEDTEIFKLLLQAGADPDITEKDGTTALMVASRLGNKELVRILLEAGSDPNRLDEDGYSSLMWASGLGYEGVMQLLLAAGADPNLSQKGNCALYMAIMDKHTGAVRRLLEAGANPNWHTDYGSSLLKVAAFHQSPEIESLLRQYGAE